MMRARFGMSYNMSLFDLLAGLSTETEAVSCGTQVATVVSADMLNISCSFNSERNKLSLSFETGAQLLGQISALESPLSFKG